MSNFESDSVTPLQFFYYLIAAATLVAAPHVRADPPEENQETASTLAIASPEDNDDLNTIRIRSGFNIDERLIDPETGDVKPVKGQFDYDLLFLRAAHEVTSQQLADLDNFTSENIPAGTSPAAQYAVFRFQRINNKNDDPLDGRMIVREAEFMDVTEARQFLDEQRASIEAQSATLLAGENGPRGHFDTSSGNVGLMAIRGSGIVGLTGLVVVIEGAPFITTFTQAFVPALVSMYLTLVVDGWKAWNQGNTLNPFALKVGDLKSFKDSPTMDRFPLRLLRKLPVPLPFLNPTPGREVPPENRVKMLSAKSMLRMFGFLCTYIAIAATTNDYFTNVLSEEHSFLSPGINVLDDYLLNFNFLTKLSAGASAAILGELLTVRLLGDLHDRRQQQNMANFFSGSIATEEAQRVSRRNHLKLSAGIVAMSIVNSIAQIRAGVSEWGLLTVGDSDNPYFIINDGHAMMASLVVALSIGYTKIFVYPNSKLLKMPGQMIKRVWQKITGSSSTSSANNRPPPDQPQPPSCPNAFAP